VTEPTLTLEDIDLIEAKIRADVPPEHVPDAVGLPDDVRDGPVSDDDGSSPNHFEGD
jgi:hypothetical protein